MTPDHLLPVFSFRPNWHDGIVEALEWFTDLLDAKRTGAEQRIALRLTPRRSFEARLDLIGTERTFADLFLRRFHAAEFMVPVWHDNALLTSAAAIGASTLAVDTVDREFVDDGMALLVGDDALSCEAVRIDTVSASSISLVSPTTLTWRAGTTIHPLRRSRFNSDIRLSNLTDTVAQGKLTFELSQANPYDGGTEELEAYAGRPILSPAPDWSKDIDLELVRALFETDSKTGFKSVSDPAGRSFSTQMHRWFLKGRSDLAAFYRLLYRLSGKQGSIWLPSFTSDLTIASAATAGATAIDVVKCGLDYADAPSPGREYAITATGEVLHFTSLGTPSTGKERLNLSAPLAADLDVGAVLSWVDIGRLDSDRIELFHPTDSDGVTQVEAPFRTFSNTRDGGAPGTLDLPTAEMTDTGCNVPSDTPSESPCYIQFRVEAADALDSSAIGLLTFLNNSDICNFTSAGTTEQTDGGANAFVYANLGAGTMDFFVDVVPDNPALEETYGVELQVGETLGTVSWNLYYRRVRGDPATQVFTETDDWTSIATSNATAAAAGHGWFSTTQFTPLSNELCPGDIGGGGGDFPCIADPPRWPVVYSIDMPSSPPTFWKDAGDLIDDYAWYLRGDLRSKDAECNFHLTSFYLGSIPNNFGSGDVPAGFTVTDTFTDPVTSTDATITISAVRAGTTLTVTVDCDSDNVMLRQQYTESPGTAYLSGGWWELTIAGSSGGWTTESFSSSADISLSGPSESGASPQTDETWSTATVPGADPPDDTQINYNFYFVPYLDNE